MRTVEELLGEIPALRTLAPHHREAIAACGRLRVYEAGEAIMREGAPADEFFIIRTGDVAVSTAIPGRGAVTLETLHDGEPVGWGWLVPPYRCAFDIHALDTAHLVCFDAACLRERCEADPALGHDLLKLLAAVFTKRLHETRLRLLDLYRYDV